MAVRLSQGYRVGRSRQSRLPGSVGEHEAKKKPSTNSAVQTCAVPKQIWRGCFVERRRGASELAGAVTASGVHPERHLHRSGSADVLCWRTGARNRVAPHGAPAAPAPYCLHTDNVADTRPRTSWESGRW